MLGTFMDLCERVGEMPIVRELDLSLLWTDSLYIVQDHATNELPILQHMDAIHASAYLTIVAAEGVDANASLPGSQTQSQRTVPKPFVTSLIYSCSQR